MPGLRNATVGALAGVQLTAADISGLTITAADIANATITYTKLTSGAATGYLTPKYLQKDCVTCSQIANNAILDVNVAAGTLSPRKLSSGAATGLLTGKYMALGSVSPRTLTSGAATGLLTGKYLSLGSVTPLTLTSGAATGLLTYKYVQAGTVKNANLSSPEGYFTLRTRLAKRACNQAAASVAFLGTLPVAASLVSAYAAASNVNNVALTTPGCCVWITNGTNRLLSGSGITVSSTAFLARSGVVQSAVQAANARIFVSAKTSTTLSALGVDVVTVWKAPHST